MQPPVPELMYHGDPDREHRFWQHPEDKLPPHPQWDCHDPADFCDNRRSLGAVRSIYVGFKAVSEFQCLGHPYQQLVYHGDPDREHRFWQYPQSNSLATAQWDCYHPSELCDNYRRLGVLRGSGANLVEFVCRGHQTGQAGRGAGSVPAQARLTSLSDAAKEAQKYFLPRAQLKLLYDSALHGDAPQNFHSHCDNHAPTLVVVQAGSDYFGGFTDRKWTSNRTFFKPAYTGPQTPVSFLFTLRNPHNLPPTRYDCAVRDRQTASDSACGPDFGFDRTSHGDLVIQPKGKKTSFSDLGLSYRDTTGLGAQTFTGAREFIATAYQVYDVFVDSESKDATAEERTTLPIGAEYVKPDHIVVLDETVGEGHFGAVRKGTLNGVVVALKSLKGDQDNGLTLKREIEISVECWKACPDSVCRVYMQWRDPSSQLWMIMDYYELGSLEQFLNSPTQSDWQLNTLRSCARALSALHKAQFCIFPPYF